MSRQPGYVQAQMETKEKKPKAVRMRAGRLADLMDMPLDIFLEVSKPSRIPPLCTYVTVPTINNLHRSCHIWSPLTCSACPALPSTSALC